MNLVEVMERFPDQESCIEYLEGIRWKDKPVCLHCESEHVRRRNEREIGRIGRWNCHDCRSTFKVTHGTIFQGTPPSEMVSRYLTDGKCEEKPIQLPTRTWFRTQAGNMLAYHDGDTYRNGERKPYTELLRQTKPISAARDVKTMTEKKANPVSVDVIQQKTLY